MPLFKFLSLVSCPNACSGNGFCDGTLSPPQCRCDPFYVGDDCSSLTSGDGSSQDSLNIGIGAAVGGLMAVLLFLVITIPLGYWAWQSYQRKVMRKKIATASALVFNDSARL